MAYDEALADRFRDAVEGIAGLSERRMMGGLRFFVNGHTVGGVDPTKSGEGRFMFRVGKDSLALADRLPAGAPMVQGGRRMSGFYVVAEGACDPAVLGEWLSLALRHATSCRRNDSGGPQPGRLPGAGGHGLPAGPAGQ